MRSDKRKSIKVSPNYGFLLQALWPEIENEHDAATICVNSRLIFYI